MSIAAADLLQPTHQLAMAVTGPPQLLLACFLCMLPNSFPAWQIEEDNHDMEYHHQGKSMHRMVCLQGCSQKDAPRMMRSNGKEKRTSFLSMYR